MPKLPNCNMNMNGKANRKETYSDQESTMETGHNKKSPVKN